MNPLIPLLFYASSLISLLVKGGVGGRCALPMMRFSLSPLTRISTDEVLALISKAHNLAGRMSKAHDLPSQRLITRRGWALRASDDEVLALTPLLFHACACMCMCVCVRERESERARDIETDRQTDR